MEMQHTPPARLTMTIKEFTELFGVSRQTFYNEVRAGRLRKFKVGRKTLIPVEEADRWYRDRLRDAGIEWSASNTPVYVQ